MCCCHRCGVLDDDHVGRACGYESFFLTSVESKSVRIKSTL